MVPTYIIYWWVWSFKCVYATLFTHDCLLYPISHIWYILFMRYTNKAGYDRYVHVWCIRFCRSAKSIQKIKCENKYSCDVVQVEPTTGNCRLVIEQHYTYILYFDLHIRSNVLVGYVFEETMPVRELYIMYDMYDMHFKRSCIIIFVESMKTNYLIIAIIIT